MLSVVIPVFNEDESLETLYKELDEVASAEGYDLDLVFVDDGSTDASWEKIRGLAAADPRVLGLRFRRNFGKAAAFSAGFAGARGELVMTLDADLQDDPHEIPRFLAEMENDLDGKVVDVVSGWKKLRHDPWHKVWPSRVFNWMVSKLTGVKLHDHNCGMKCYRREIFDEVRLYGELHRFVPVLAAGRGYRVGELEIGHRRRQFGRSKYGLPRFVKGFLDLLTVRFLTGFGQRPQHVLGTIGLGSFLLGGLGLLYLATRWGLSRLLVYFELIRISAEEIARVGIDQAQYDALYQLGDRPAVLYSVALLLLGGQLMSIGFLGELFVAYHTSHIKAYSIAERTDAAVSNSAARSSDDPSPTEQ